MAFRLIGRQRRWQTSQTSLLPSKTSLTLHTQSHRLLCSSKPPDSLEHIRNIGILAHIDAGKTTTTERMLFYSGVIHRMGEVHDGDTTMDFLPQERERGITIGAAAISFPWRSTNINVIDTPGHVDFTIEVERAVRVLDGAVAVIDGVAGVEAQTETVWEQADRYHVPRLAFVNKLDREGASFTDCCSSIESHFGVQTLEIQFPLGESDTFEGILDLINMEMVKWLDKDGKILQRLPILHTNHGKMAELYEFAREKRQILIETACDFDDALADLYLSNNEIDSMSLKKALRRIVTNSANASSVILTLCGSALKNKGIQPLLDAIVDYLPSPLDTSPIRARKSARIPHKTRPKESDIQLFIDDKAAPLCAIAFKVQYDRQRGLITYFRVYSGVLRAKDQLLNASRNQKERITRLMRVAADDREEVSEIGPGDIGAVIGLKNTFTGDTLIRADNPSLILLPGVHLPSPVFTCSIEAESSTQEKELQTALHYLQREDPSFVVRVDDETGQTLISGMGELHLDIIKEKLRAEYKLELMTGPMQVATLESVEHKASVRYVHDVQLGPDRQYAQLEVQVEPLVHQDSDTKCLEDPIAVIITWKDHDQVEIPPAFVVAVEKGLRSACSRGIISNSRLASLKITINGAKCAWDNDTDANAFRVCATYALKQALREADPIILEPMMKVQVQAPERCIGDILSDLNAYRRACVQEVTSATNQSTKRRHQKSLIQAQVPLIQMTGYATSLRSITQGEGTFSMEFSEYQKVDPQILEKFGMRN